MEVFEVHYTANSTWNNDPRKVAWTAFSSRQGTSW